MSNRQNRTTAELKLSALRERLKDKCDNGMLGTVAARTRIPEHVLYDWCHDPNKLPSLSELSDLRLCLAHEHYSAQAALAIDPNDTIFSEQLALELEPQGYDPRDSLPAFLRRQAE